MRRREFITLLGGRRRRGRSRRGRSSRERMRRIGVLLPATADDPEFQARVGAFLQGLALLGWTIGRNVRIDTRWATANAADIRRHAAELVALAPDVILSHGASTVGTLLQATRTVPIVFPVVADPVGAGFVDSLARPGGNATGFMTAEYSIGGKWLELLKQIAPGVARVAVLRNATQGSGTSEFAAIQAVAPSLRVEVNPINTRDASEIERAVAAFARPSNGGLIVTAGASATLHRALIITLAARHKLPAVYYERFFVAAGGLVSYGPDYVDQYRRAAGYVDRILKGEKPADLPVQAPTKYELVINLKTAKALGLDSAADAARPRRRGDRMRAARVHHAARRRGGVAARGARAAAGQAADHRVLGRGHAFGSEPMDCRFCAAAARTRLDRGSHRRDRVSLGGGTQRALRRDRGRVRPAQGRCHCHVWQPQQSLRQSRRHRSSRSCSRWRRTRSAPAWSQVWRDRAATSPACRSRRADLAGKRLELLREVVPGLRRLAILANVGNPAAVLEMGEVQAAARTLGLEVATLEIRRAEDIAPAFEALKGRAEALYVAVDPLMITNRIRINTLALGARLPTMYGLREYVEAGGLMSYGPNFPDLFRRAADYVDKILRGAKPADIPVEQPTKFDLVINLITAKALGLDVPPTLLARADEVIE